MLRYSRSLAWAPTAGSPMPKYSQPPELLAAACGSWVNCRALQLPSTRRPGLNGLCLLLAHFLRDLARNKITNVLKVTGYMSVCLLLMPLEIIHPPKNIF